MTREFSDKSPILRVGQARRALLLPVALLGFAAYDSAQAQFGGPDADDDNYTVEQGSSGNSLPVVNNDSGLFLRIVDVDDISDGGTVQIAGDARRLIYTPAPGFSGTEEFEYTVRDAFGREDDADVRVTVTRTNQPPDANDDTFSVDESSNNNELNVLANDSDPDQGDSIRIVDVDGADGDVDILGNGSRLRYTPPDGFTGTDTFDYEIEDDDGESDRATVRVTVLSGNSPPTARNDSYGVDEDSGASELDVLANDDDPDQGDSIRIVDVDGADGDVAIVASGTRIRYTPPAGFTGTDNFDYEIEDDDGESDTATVTVTVSNVNDVPVITGQRSLSTAEDNAITINLGDLTVDDPDNSYPGDFSLTVRDGANYSRSDRTVTPNQDFAGTLNVPVVVNDGAANSAPFTLRISVTPVNDPPEFTSSPRRSASEDQSYRYRLEAADPDGDRLTFGAPDLPGWLTLDGDTLSGTPSADDAGAHPVSVTVSDGTAAAVAQRFEITVSGVNDSPIIEPDPIPDQTAVENTFTEIDLTQFVSDEDDEPASLTYRLASSSDPLPAGLGLNPTGFVSGTPEVGSSVGDHRIRFIVSDGENDQTSEPFVLSVLAADRVDIGVGVSASPNPAAIGELVTWTLSITNNTPATAVPDISVRANLEGALGFSFDPVPTGCTLTGSGAEAVVECAIDEAIPGGGVTTILLTGTVPEAGDVSLVAAVSIEGSLIDETPRNDKATGTLGVAGTVVVSAAQELPGIDARGAAGGDFDGDGFGDLAVATGSSEATLVLLNVVDPENPSKRKLSETPIRAGSQQTANAVTAGDIDGDGDFDIVTAGAEVELLLNDGDAQFTVVPVPSAAGARAAAIGDVDGDGLADLVLARNGANALYRGMGAGALGAEEPFGGRDTRDLALVDLLGTALPEIVLANADGDAEIYNLESGLPVQVTEIPTGPTSSTVGADFDGDGVADLGFGAEAPRTGRSAATNLVFLNRWASSGELSAPTELDAGPTIDVLATDPDQDGDSDLVFVNSGGGLRTFLNTDPASGAFEPHPAQLAGAGALAAAAASLGMDDRIDVALVGPNGISVYYSDGRGNFGLGDTAAPSIALRGAANVTLTVGAAYTDEGATATDALDGDISEKVVVENDVDTAVIGTYEVVYRVTDSSGNAASPVMRTVVVQAREGTGGGGGGAVDVLSMMMLLAYLCLARTRCRVAIVNAAPPRRDRVAASAQC